MMALFLAYNLARWASVMFGSLNELRAISRSAGESVMLRKSAVRCPDALGTSLLTGAATGRLRPRGDGAGAGRFSAIATGVADSACIVARIALASRSSRSAA